MEMETESENVKKVEYNESCPNCGEPMMEKLSISGEKVMGCRKYPRCYPRDYDSSDSD